MLKQLIVQMHAVIIASLYMVSMNIQMHPKASMRFSIWSTTSHIIDMLDDVDLSRYKTLGQ
jgi:hypothetical protein